MTVCEPAARRPMITICRATQWGATMQSSVTNNLPTVRQTIISLETDKTLCQPDGAKNTRVLRDKTPGCLRAIVIDTARHPSSCGHLWAAVGSQYFYARNRMANTL